MPNSLKKMFMRSRVRFNLASPKQLGEVLFEILKLTQKKKTKRVSLQPVKGITKLAGNNPIVADILGFRELTKLRSTYVDTLPQIINSKRVGYTLLCTGHAV